VHSGTGTVWQLGRLSCQDTAAARSHALQTLQRALQALRRKSIVLRRFSVARKAYAKLLEEAFDSVGGKAAPRTKHADSFRDSWSLSVHSEPLKLPSSGPSETSGADTNGDRAARGEGLVERPNL
jgi:hypothetical protein